jgi:integrase
MRRQAGSTPQRILSTGERVWDARYRDPQGRNQQKRGFKTKTAAQEYLRTVLTAVADETYIRPTRMTFGEYLRAWLSGRPGSIKPSTLRSYHSMATRHLLPTFGARPLQALSAGEVNVFLAERTSLSVKTRKNLVVLLNTVLEHAVAEQRISRNPLDSPLLQRPRAILAAEEVEEIEIFTPSEVSAILDALEPHWVPMFHFDYMTGLRLGELLGVQWQDIDFERRQLRVRRSLDKGQAVTVKSRHGRRSVDLGDQLLGMLGSMRRERASEAHDAYIFRTPAGGAIDPDNLRTRVWEPALAKAAVRFRPIKSLRHSFASLLIREGHDPLYIAKVMGHHSAAFTLKTYCHLFPGERRDANRIEAGFFPRGRAVDTNAGKEPVSREVSWEDNPAKD